MLVFGTEMHVVTFVFVLLELIMFGYQVIHYLSRPQDKTRLWYMILLNEKLLFTRKSEILYHRKQETLSHNIDFQEDADRKRTKNATINLFDKP